MLPNDNAFVFNCKGQLLDLSSPKVMGILNITDDSFYAPSRISDSETAVSRAAQMMLEGATILDIGGQSTRPGAEIKSIQAEMDAVLPIIEELHKAFPDTILSIDTFRAEVAKAAVAAGASIVNDVSGGNLDENMFETVGGLGVPYVCMHMRGTPETMQNLTEYDDLFTEMYDYFVEKLFLLKKHGVHDVILDMGFGFAKTYEINFEIIKKLHIFATLKHPILAGISRKRFIANSLKQNSTETLHAVCALHMVLLQQGARLLRVHDVKPAVDCIKMWTKLYDKQH